MATREVAGTGAGVVRAPAVAIAFPVREKFGWALPALRRIYAWTGVPFRLYFVDCGYPPGVRAEIDAFLAGRGNVVDIRASRFLFSNECMNEIIPRVEEPYLCIVQNDVLVHPGYLARMLDTMRRFDAALCSPLIYEYHDGRRELHRDEFTDTVITTAEGRIRAQQPRPAEAPPVDHDAPRRVQHFELHSLALTTRAARAMWPLPYINVHEHIDLAIHAWRLGLAAAHDPGARVGYVLPPIRPYDVPYYRYRWDVQHARHSHVYLCRRWNMPVVPGVMGFAEEMAAWARPERVKPDGGDASESDVYEDAVAETSLRAPEGAA